MTQGINRLLQRGDPDVVGVFAQLGHVNEPRLSAVLAANYASSLQVRRYLCVCGAGACVRTCVGQPHPAAR